MSRTPADYQLCLQTREGDDWAFEELLRRYRHVVHGEAMKYGAPGETRDDILQAARVGLWKAAKTYRPDRGSSFRVFAQLTIHAELVTTLIAAKRQKHTHLNDSVSLATPITDEPDAPTVADLVPAPDDVPGQVAVREHLRWIVRTVRRCTWMEREALADYLSGTRFVNSDKSMDNALQRVREKLRAAA